MVKRAPEKAYALGKAPRDHEIQSMDRRIDILVLSCSNPLRFGDNIPEGDYVWG
jgi:hypothetical protein